MSATALDRASTAPAGDRWDAEVLAAGGHLLQGWTWGDFKRRHGWEVERVRVERGGETGLAQVLFKTRGPVSIGYVPPGPVLTAADPALFDALLDEVGRVARGRRAISLILEPDRPLPLDGCRTPLKPGPPHVQPGRTVKVPLQADEPMLMAMHQKTRYNIRLSQRKGVTVLPEDPVGPGFDDFYTLMQDTSARNEFGIHAPAYYRDVLRSYGDAAAMLVARIPSGEAAAAMIVVAFGNEAVYLYGASSTLHRSLGPGFALQFAAMQWARDVAGCGWYDLWGIPMQDPDTTHTDDGARIAGTRGDDWRGLYEFKVRFGGPIVAYPPTLEREYLPLVSGLARRVYRPGG